MNYSTETIYHFSCISCDLWWSIAAENMRVEKHTWTCPWCAYEHKPPHKNIVEELRREKNDSQLKHEEKVFGR